MPYASLRCEVVDSVATISLDAPGTRNALSDAVLDDLLAAFADARDDAGVRCVVLASTHERVFSAGGDLAGFTADVPLVDRHAANDRFPRLFELIGRLGKPVVCAVGGHALGGAVGLALACDLVVASEAATFGTPEIGVVNRVVAPDALDAAVDEWAQALAGRSPLLLRLGKDALYAQQEMGFVEALAHGRAQLSLALSSDDAREGAAAFLERREPRWTGS